VIRTPHQHAEQTPGELLCVSDVDLSIIVPACDEEGSVRQLYRAILGTLETIDRTFEIIFVDDGSTDRTFARCAELAGHDRRVRVIKFRRNHGQTAAMVAGMDHARGRILVTLDADLQNDPADIPTLIEKIDQGYDLVVGWRHQRQDKALSRKLPSVLANWLIGMVTGVPIRDNGCSLKAYRADLMRKVPLYAEMHRFIPAMASLAGARIAEIKVRHHGRRFGQSKYGLSRTYKVLMDLLAVKTLLAFARRPLLCFIGAAAVPGILGVLFFLLSVVYVIGELQAAPTVVFAGIAMLFGVLALFLVLIGLIGYLIYHAAADAKDQSLPLLGSTELGVLDD
jgi:glycosyltransferase involved in cell wall biosynthesis